MRTTPSRSHLDLPSMGGAFERKNLALYGYAHLNPSTLKDPTG